MPKDLAMPIETSESVIGDSVRSRSCRTLPAECRRRQSGADAGKAKATRCPENRCVRRKTHSALQASKLKVAF